MRVELITNVFSSIPIYFKWISYASWFEYGNEALMINQWKGIENINCTASVSSICPKDGHVVLEMFNFSEVSHLCTYKGIN